MLKNRMDESDGSWNMEKKQYRLLTIVMVALLLLVMPGVGREIAKCVAGESLILNSWQDVLDLFARNELVSKDALAVNGQADMRPCVVIDAGHGGRDPGKVGSGELLEKDINLQIAERVRLYLEANDVRVVMTRREDVMLETGDGSSKKSQDMKARVNMIETASPQVVVSIHQNSYPSEEVHGAQAFYYTGSSEGSRLAELLQKAMVTYADPENNRQIKGDNTYYLLKHVSVPIVIVECGFLTNPQEARKLADPEYQDRMAWAIHLGILQYLTDSV